MRAAASIRRIIFGVFDRWWWRPCRWLAAKAVAETAVVALAIFAVFRFWRPQSATCTHVTCSVGVNLLSSLILAGLAYVIYLLWTRTRVLQRYRRQMCGHPERIVWGARRGPDFKKIVSRDSLCRAVAKELRVESEHIPLVIGELGSGKTTFMAELVAHLARRGAIPVFVSLRNEKRPFDIPALARKRFKRHVNHLLGSAAAADRLWRQICRQDLVVVLADGLDEALAEGQVVDADELSVESMHSDRRRHGHLVVASRPESVATRTGYSIFPLEPLDGDEAVRLLVDELSPQETPREVAEEDARRLVETLDITSTPFYLQILRTLISNGVSKERLAGVCGERAAGRRATQDQARVALLDLLVENATGQAWHEAGVSGASAQTSIRELDCIAYETLGKPSFELADVRRAGTKARIDAEAIANGRRLGLLAPGTAQGTHIRFSHPILKAYLASRFLAGTNDDHRTECMTELLDGEEPSAGNDERLLALRMFAARSVKSADLRTKLITRAVQAEDGDAADGLSFTVAAIRVAASEKSTEAAEAALTAVDASSIGATDVAQPSDGIGRVELASRRIETIKALADLARTLPFQDLRVSVYLKLWRLGEDPMYPVRWQTVEAFVDAGMEGYMAIADPVAVLSGTVARLLREDLDRDRRRGELEGRHLPDLSVLAKFLPGVAAREYASSHTKGPACKALEDLIALVTSLTERKLGIGVEASLAQGFKHAADIPGAQFLQDLLIPPKSHGDPFSKTAVFWYSKVNILQALARRGIKLADGGGDRAALAPIRNNLKRARHEHHPFVAEAAKLCLKAVKLARSGRMVEARSYLWDDESLEVSRSGAHLAEDASRLLADIVIVLNMNEQERYNGKRKTDPEDVFGQAVDLPSCLKDAEGRDWLLQDGPVCRHSEACRLDLCAYRPNLAVHSHAYRGMGAAFCRNQQRLASRLTPLPWQRDLSAKRLKDFWTTMEEKRTDEVLFPRRM